MPSEVLTPQQIRDRLAGRPVVPLKAEDKLKMREVLLEDKLKQVEKNIKDVQAAAVTKRMTPAELRKGIDLLFQKYNFSPVEELIMTAQGTADESLSTRICMFLTEFLMPKLKSIEVSGTVDHNHTVVIRRFGPQGEVRDEPMKRIPGLPAADAPVKRAIDVEVMK